MIPRATFRTFSTPTRRNLSKLSTIDYCVDLVRKNEHENFMCTLLIPKAIRNTAFAIRAFNVEIAQIPDKAKDKQLASARMAFWQDALDKIYKGQPPEHPVALELARAVKHHKLHKKHLSRLLKARLNALNSATFQNVQDVEKYAEETASPIFYMLLNASGVQSMEVDHAASHLGKAQGVCNVIRAIPHLAAHRTVMLPQDLMTKHNVVQEDVIRQKCIGNLREVVFELASTANIHLKKARNLQEDVPKIASSIFLPAVPLSSFLETLRNVDFNVYDEFLVERNVHLGYSLIWKKLLSKY
ncbi:NADH dehydrogenase (ubiquinone) complex I, assembly factor 6 [Cimex lectularius]|uniref:15-cis-phytoene synthase n=1 Tax=Cimex lectularius TaxID=79782 RepID=A0A8I6RNN7_CIMLE|nr:NADH dehydrogenase (ubiquinone) complex I, assembly factor 6 [Cimex lectularius]